jgi:hypothetical protein
MNKMLSAFATAGLVLAGGGMAAADDGLKVDPFDIASPALEAKLDSLDIRSFELIEAHKIAAAGRMARLDFRGADRQSAVGFIRFAQVYADAVRGAGEPGRVADRARSLDDLVGAFNYYTQIEASQVEAITYSDPQLFSLPIIDPEGVPSEVEMQLLARYLQEGGFVLASPGDFLLFREGLEKYAGLVWGQDMWIQRIAADHPLFTAFFTIKGGVPSPGSRALATGDSPPGGPTDWNFLSGFFLGDRLVAVEYDLGMAYEPDTSQETIRRQQMAINIVVFALTQEGSLAADDVRP